MALVKDPKTGRTRVIESCRSCGADIYWSTTDKDKACPYDVVDGEPTRESHFRSCPHARQWSKRASSESV
jgi:hypothetical protein